MLWADATWRSIVEGGLLLGSVWCTCIQLVCPHDRALVAEGADGVLLGRLPCDDHADLAVRAASSQPLASSDRALQANEALPSRRGRGSRFDPPGPSAHWSAGSPCPDPVGDAGGLDSREVGVPGAGRVMDPQFAHSRPPRRPMMSRSPSPRPERGLAESSSICHLDRRGQMGRVEPDPCRAFRSRRSGTTSCRWASRAGLIIEDDLPIDPETIGSKVSLTWRRADGSYSFARGSARLFSPSRRPWRLAWSAAQSSVAALRCVSRQRDQRRRRARRGPRLVSTEVAESYSAGRTTAGRSTPRSI